MPIYQPADEQDQHRAERLLTKPQLAQRLGVTQRTLDRWQVDGRLPDDLRVTIGGAARYRENVADRWIAAGCPAACDDLRDARVVDG